VATVDREDEEADDTVEFDCVDTIDVVTELEPLAEEGAEEFLIEPVVVAVSELVVDVVPGP
jgi:hypothetical protein